jgi:hypothetical protein
MRRIGVLLVLLVLADRTAGAQDVGSVAAVSGVAEIKRGALSTAAVVGAGVQVGDELRTGDGQLRVVFQDDSVIDLGERSTLIVDEHVFDPSASRYSTLMNLVVGKARALVSHYYGTPGAAYQMHTPTAVAGVRGTSFLVTYDVDRDVTEVVGIQGFVQVRNLTADADEFIYIGAEETTQVLRDSAPTAPQRIDERLFRDDVRGLEQLSLGSHGAVASGAALASTVSPPEQAPASGGQVGQLGRDQLRNTADVVGQPLRGDRGRLGVPF